MSAVDVTVAFRKGQTDPETREGRREVLRLAAEHAGFQRARYVQGPRVRESSDERYGLAHVRIAEARLFRVRLTARWTIDIEAADEDEASEIASVEALDHGERADWEVDSVKQISPGGNA